MNTNVCFFFAVILAGAWMYMDGAYANWRAAQLQHEWNKRGFVGCENGQFIIKNFDVEGFSMREVFRLPDAGRNPCAKTIP